MATLKKIFWLIATFENTVEAHLFESEGTSPQIRISELFELVKVENFKSLENSEEWLNYIKKTRNSMKIFKKSTTLESVSSFRRQGFDSHPGWKFFSFSKVFRLFF